MNSKPVQEYPYHFVHWIDLDRDHLIIHDHERFGRFKMELFRTLCDHDYLSEDSLAIPTALRLDSMFKVSKFRLGKSSKTIGLVFGIEDVLINPVRLNGDKEFRRMSIIDILMSGETIFETKYLNELKYCKGVVTYISEIEVEYINFALKRPCKFEDVIDLYTASTLDVVKKSSLYQALQIFKKYNLEIPVFFCVKAISEPISSQTKIGTIDAEREADFEHTTCEEKECECRCSCDD